MTDAPRPPRQRICLLGGGALARQLVTWAGDTPDLRVVGALDDRRAVGAEVSAGVPVLGGLREAEGLHADGAFDACLFAIGYRHLGFKRARYGELRGRIPFATLVHPTAFVGPGADIGEGCVLFPHAIVDQGARLLPDTLVNVGACVSHDCTVGPHAFLAPRAVLSGFVTVGACCFVGDNATLVDGIAVAEGVTLGAGAVAVADLPAAGTYVGVPARRL